VPYKKHIIGVHLETTMADIGYYFKIFQYKLQQLT